MNKTWIRDLKEIRDREEERDMAEVWDEKEAMKFSERKKEHKGLKKLEDNRDPSKEFPLKKLSETALVEEEEISVEEKKSTSEMYYGIWLYLHLLPFLLFSLIKDSG